MDAKTAETIVEIYRNIQLIQNICLNENFNKNSLLSASCSRFDILVNDIFKENNQEKIAAKITKLLSYINEVDQLQKEILTNENKFKLEILFSKLSNDLTHLKNNIND